MGLKAPIYSRQSLSGSFKHRGNRPLYICTVGIHPKVSGSQKNFHVPWLRNMLISEGSKGNTRIQGDSLAWHLVFESHPLTRHERKNPRKGRRPPITNYISHLEATRYLVSMGWQENRTCSCSLWLNFRGCLSSRNDTLINIISQSACGIHFYKALQRTKGVQKGFGGQFFNSQYGNSHQPPVY